MSLSSKWSRSPTLLHPNRVSTSPLPHTCYMPRPPHSSRFDIPNNAGEQCRSFSSSLCSLLRYPITSSLPTPNILLSALFSNTLSLHSSLHMSDQVSHPYKTTGKFTVLCFLIYAFVEVFYSNGWLKKVVVFGRAVANPGGGVSGATWSTICMCWHCGLPGSYAVLQGKGSAVVRTNVLPSSARVQWAVKEQLS